MVGSSPQPLLVHIPGYGDVPPTGYVEELWVKKNVDTAILQNTHWTSFLVLGLTLGVCALYIVSVSYLSVLGRLGGFAILLSPAWGVLAARIAWGLEEGLFSEEEMPLRVERLEQSAAPAYALVQRMAEEGWGE